MTFLRKSIFAAVLSLPLFATSSLAEQVTLSADQMLVATRNALAARQPGVALRFATAYLDAYPDSVLMLVLKSRAERDLGQNKDARNTAKQAWKLAETEGQKYSAAMVAAQASASGGNKMAGQFWLRRASNHAATPAQKRQLRQDFNYVRARNPWRLQLDFGLTPSSNVNDGSSEDGGYWVFGGTLLPVTYRGASRPLSGLEGHLGATLTYRFAESKTTRSFVGTQIFHKEVWLNDPSDAAPASVSGADFRYSSVALTYRHQRLLGQNRGMLDFDMRLGRNWYGGTPLSVLFGAGLQFHLPPKAGKRLSLQLKYDLQSSDSAYVDDIHTTGIGLRYRMPWQKNRLTLKADYQTAASRDITRAYDEYRLGIDMDFGKALAGNSISGGVTGSYREYAQSPHTLDGRRDKTFSAFAEMTLNSVSYWGFSPVVSVNHTRTSSNAARFTKSETALGLSIRSQF
ncbi:Protein of unknown function [Aliiroseovarius crassostreae]|uniref:DUF560 domain-containing protein n=1 Tax=Aliiroseovarius crassostreae TaxID=154981 RepID=A0A0P7IVH9_9RHOB|nr:surface lipoprotein assembly modifier [Aliiroseovarius crassostreae]KPN63178.1 hypothetical protein AKJ29_10765 [Aliiroseovarius crassostreae]SFU58626.1 Protein of unknown function [Aliiroseovarius crassostreae]